MLCTVCLPEVQGHQVVQHDLLVQARPNKEGDKGADLKTKQNMKTGCITNTG